MIKLRDLIAESTFQINSDVDYIYRIGGFKDFIMWYKQGKKPYSAQVEDGRNVVFAVIDSSSLPSATAKKCHSLNPIRIHCGIAGNGSFYGTTTSGPVMAISLNLHALKVLYRGNVQRQGYTKTSSTMIHNDITQARIKGTINHELAHWMDDTLHNSHILRKFKTAAETHKSIASMMHSKDVNASYLEIEAQVASIKQLHRSRYRTWDKITMNQLFAMIPTLAHIAETIYNAYGSKAIEQWQRKLMTRLNREGLLGKNMRNFVYGYD